MGCIKDFETIDNRHLDGNNMLKLPLHIRYEASLWHRHMQ